MADAIRPVVAIVQARMTSTRLPGKVMMPLAGAPLIRRMIERVLRIEGLDRVVIALAQGEKHDPVIGALDGMDVSIERGSEDDVLSRYADAARASGAATVMRVTSDCPLLDPEISGKVLTKYLSERSRGLQYARTAPMSGFPLGFDTEVFSAKALFEAEAEALDGYEREHVTPYIQKHLKVGPANYLDDAIDNRRWRLTVDTEADYRLACAIYNALYRDKPHFGYADIVSLFQARPDLLAAAEGNSTPAHAAAH
jgi:spore coat polysaccharide biosynthesis protein SpsF